VLLVINGRRKEQHRLVAWHLFYVLSAICPKAPSYRALCGEEEDQDVLHLDNFASVDDFNAANEACQEARLLERDGF